MSSELSVRGFVFWPVGCGDSTTVVVDDETVVQVDLHHVEEAEQDEDPRAPIVDRLVDALPKGADGRPHLAAFGATHLDKDHIEGFAELLDRVSIGDLWFTPRILWEHQDDPEAELSEDAKAFINEAERRIKVMKKKGAVGSGDRIRIIGYHDVLKEHSEIYEDLPEASITVPGSRFTAIDGEDKSGAFEAFVHAPFKDDTEGERNDTSFALRITLKDGTATARVMLLGDLSYPTLRRIFDRSKEDDLQWNVFLTPHHCSKSAMYWQGEGESQATLKQDLLDAIEEASIAPSYIIASSISIPESDVKGANPPHAIAAEHYEELVEAGHFLCTGDHASEHQAEPIVFELGSDQMVLRDAAEVSTSEAGSRLKKVAEAARGTSSPAAAPVGFGRE